MLILSIGHLRRKLVSVSTLIVLLIVSTLGVDANSEIMVHPGDNLNSLAQKYHVSVTTLRRRNRLGDRVTLNTNRKITLPNMTNAISRPQPNGSKLDQNTQDRRYSTFNLSPREQAAKNWIAYHESRGKYHVSNGSHYGKFELDCRLLKGDYSGHNQERTADRYVYHRYGSWLRAKHFWEHHDWY